MRTVHLHGHLGERFGRQFTLGVETPREAVRALAVQLPGFEAAIRAGNWHVVRGPLDDRDEVFEDGLELSLGAQRELHIIPAIEGANSGWVSVIVGVVLIAVGFVTANPALVAVGVGMAVGGIIQMTMQMPGVDETASTEQNASYIFNGPTNRSAQGVAVPRGYGRLKIGSIVVSAGLFAEEMPV